MSNILLAFFPKALLTLKGEIFSNFANCPLIGESKSSQKKLLFFDLRK